ncbi:hypothetical protein BXO88_15725 [Oribacterium sp. C9]|nr:hypothetical protein BXO88_15725 [Oribacterium sp. C9]
MSKYSFEFKKEVVLAYLNGEGGYTYLKNKYDIMMILFKNTVLFHLIYIYRWHRLGLGIL